MRSLRWPTLILLLPILGCHAAPEPQLDPETRSVDERIAPPTLHPIDPTYFALGALSEYAGYPAQHFGEQIDSFARGRAADAAVFARYLERIKQVRSIETEIVSRKTAGGCTSIVSRALKDYLIAQYPTQRTFASQQMFRGLASKRSYLAGVYLRFKHGKALRFANAPHKVRLVRELLAETGCTDISVTRTGRGHYPVFATVSYVPSQAMAQLFARVDAERTPK